jgi:hypothetical protein
VDDTEYRIEFTIQRQRPGDPDFVEIGFGSSGAWIDIDTCTHMIGSALTHGEWETLVGHPDPDDVMRDIEQAKREDTDHAA